MNKGTNRDWADKTRGGSSDLNKNIVRKTNGGWAMYRLE